MVDVSVFKEEDYRQTALIMNSHELETSFRPSLR